MVGSAFCVKFRLSPDPQTGKLIKAEYIELIIFKHSTAKTLKEHLLH